MERHKINEDQGFTMLIHASQRTNTKLRDVAAEAGSDGHAARSTLTTVQLRNHPARRAAADNAA